MKYIFSLCFLLGITGCLLAQVPQAFSYQAVARDAEGICIQNSTISLRIGIRDNAANGPVLYLERHDNIATNAQGLFSLTIGAGVPQGTPDFTTLDWSNGRKWIEVEMDPQNGPNFVLLGTQQLMSVPYALHALNKPFFDSGWFSMSSQDGVNSYKEITHALGDYPSNVKVLTRAVSGNNDGFIFEGVGSAQGDDDVTHHQYGGLVFAYNQQMVRLWAPTINNNSDGATNGRIINVIDGWGNDINAQGSDNAEVRVIVWR
ncbi:MAG: hypothetical protein AAF587_34345 [Bacteroidota bacterium]